MWPVSAERNVYDDTLKASSIKRSSLPQSMRSPARNHSFSKLVIKSNRKKELRRLTEHALQPGAREHFTIRREKSYRRKTIKPKMKRGWLRLVVDSEVWKAQKGSVTSGAFTVTRPENIQRTSCGFNKDNLKEKTNGKGAETIAVTRGRPSLQLQLQQSVLLFSVLNQIQWQI